jgi:hypothetical protein
MSREILRVFPANASILLVHADDIGHVNDTSLVV